MDIIFELESARKRMLQEINTEFDRLVALAQEDARTKGRQEYMKPYEMRYPLTAGPNIFKGKKPSSVIFGDETPIAVLTWKQVAEEILKDCVSTRQYKKALEAQRDKVRGKKRTILAADPEGMRSPLEIAEGLYMETHYDTETLLNILTVRVLGPIGYDFSDISVTVRN